MERKMMSFVCALVLFLAPSKPLRAQQSMLDGNPVWVYQQEIEWEIKNFPDNVKGINLSQNEPLNLFHIYFIKGDTTIQNRVYKKLYHEYKSEYGRYIGTNGPFPAPSRG